LIRVLVPGLIGGTIATSLIYSALYLFQIQPIKVIVGAESKDIFLRRSATSYPAMRFIKSHVPPQEKVLMLWDGQGYYCDDRCLPDAEHSRWTRLTISNPDVAALASSLKKEQIKYILFNIRDADFILQHDPTGAHRRAAKYFLKVFRPACTREIYYDQWVYLYEIICGS
jgi:hypothetical protein